MGRRRGQTGSGGAVVSSISVKAGGSVRSKADVSKSGGEHGKSKSGEAKSSEATSSEEAASGAGSSVKEIKSAGWIGKTPAIFLREWCTKHDRKRPLFSVLGGPRGADGTMRCCVPAGNRSDPSKKNGFDQIIGIGERPGEEYAALNVLHQVERGKPLERLLAPEYRDIWLDMDRRFAEAEREKARAAFHAEKNRKADEKRAKAAKIAESATISISVDSRHMIEDALFAQRASTSSEVVSDRILEDPSDASAVAESAASISHRSQEVKQNLIDLGFARQDADLASSRFDDLHMALDYLCLNLDDSELPASFAPGPDVEVVASGRSVSSESAELLSSSLCCSKYAAENALRSSKNNMLAALASLFFSLTGVSCGQVRLDANATRNAASERKLEADVLAAIYGEDVAAGIGCAPGFPTEWAVTVALRDGIHAFGSRSPVRVCVLDIDGLYPFSVPVVFILEDRNELPLVRRRAATRAAASQLRAKEPDPGTMHIPVTPVVHRIVSFLSDSSEFDLLEAAGTAHGLQARAVKGTQVLPQKDRLYHQNVGKPICISGETLQGCTSSSDVGPVATRSRNRTRQPLQECNMKRQLAPGPARTRNVSDQSISLTRKKLPAFHCRKEVLEVIRKHPVTVVSGATGSGKTTQIPQFLLEQASESNEPISVICTQPRRIAAISVAERVAAERGENVGQTVGYQVKLNVKRSHATRLVFCTTGVLLRQMQSDPNLLALSHVIVDECHERSVETDFLLLLLREILNVRSDLRVVLMSATLDAIKFSSYFSECSGQMTPTVSIPGRTYPVSERYLEEAIALTGYKLRTGDRYTKKGRHVPRNIEGEPGPWSSSVRNGDAAVSSTTRAESSLRVCGAEDDHAAYDSVPDDWDSSDNEADSESASITLIDPSRDEVPDGKHVETLELIDESQVNLDLIDLLVRQLDKDTNDSSSGAILVFLPGTAEIASLVERLSRGHGSHRLHPMPLHSALSSVEQAAIFSRPPKGRRKVICSTNIAETSVTVEDVTIVIDSVRLKEMTYDSLNGTSVLTETFVSQAAARQRSGRAGRVASGVCYRLVRRSTFERKLAAQQEPEIRRVSLEHLVLNLLSIAPGESRASNPHEFFSRAMDPPEPEAITTAVDNLIKIGALSRLREAPNLSVRKTDCAVELTSLGRHLSGLPVDPRIGKLLIFGTIFGCTDAALTIAACLSERSPFFSPREKLDAARVARQRFAWGKSDLLLMVKAYDSWIGVRALGGTYQSELDFCDNHFLSRKTLLAILDVRMHLENALYDAGFGIGSGADENSQNARVVKAVVCAALYPNIVRVDPPGTRYREVAAGAVAEEYKASELRFRSKTGERVFLHPGSVNFDQGLYENRWLAYFSKVRTGRVYIRDSTMVSPIAILLFGGDIQVRHAQEQLVVDGWVVFKSPARIAVLVRELRRNLDALLARKFEDPNLDIRAEGRALNDAIVRLIKNEF